MDAGPGTSIHSQERFLVGMSAWPTVWRHSTGRLRFIIFSTFSSPKEFHAQHEKKKERAERKHGQGNVLTQTLFLCSPIFYDDVFSLL